MDDRSSLAPAQGPRYIRFGPFQVDQQRQEVTKNGSRLRFQGKVYQVLLTLLEKPGEVVSREELRQRLWSADTHVNYDANVNTTVNKLRQILGDSSDKPLYVETIPRKGYCFLAQLELSDEPKLPVAPTSAAESKTLIATQQPASGTGITASNIWVPIGVIGLILAGMLLGAGITTLWMYHFGPATPWP
jgi:DNA-binding winged helix-turn-helix (wHTH) protein